MEDFDEPIINSNSENTSAPKRFVSTEKRIRNLAHGQLFGVLCTQADQMPYGSVVAFAFTDDLSRFIFATSRATRKYSLLTKCSNVALVVNNQADFPREMMKIEAFTVTGRASETTSDSAKSEWRRLFLGKHPQLREFVESPSTGLFVVETVRYFIVSHFQEVREWTPPGHQEP